MGYSYDNVNHNSISANHANNKSDSNKNDKRDKEKKERNKNSIKNINYINHENKISCKEKKENNLEEVKSPDNNSKKVKNKYLINENNKENDYISKERKEKEKESKEFRNLEDKNKYIEKEKEEYKVQYENLLNKYKDMMEILGKKMKDLEEKYIKLNNEKNEEIAKMTKENKELKHKYSSIEINYEDIKQRYFLLQTNNQILESKNKELREKLKEKDLQLQKYKEDQNKYKVIIEKNKLLEKENKKLNEEILLLKKIPILVGLNNIGATYYMNATLQCLSNTDELTNFFLNKFKFDASDNNKIMSNEYYNVIKNLWNRDNNNKSFSPNEFKEELSKENPLFVGIAANDSKDLINFLLERLHNELNITKNENKYLFNEINISDQLNEQLMLNIFTNEFKMKYNSIISNLFYGTLETKSQCKKCNQVKYNFQIFSFVEFPLEKVNLYCSNIGKRNNYSMLNNKNPDIDLYECFEYQNTSELMTGDNQLYCNICNSCSDSLYSSNLYSTPNYLIINLNRGRGAVYECNVNFPDQLNLFNYVSFKMGNTVYELYAVISHIGLNSMSGHFIAFCKNKIDRKWENIMMLLLLCVKIRMSIGVECLIFYFIKFY